MRHINELFLASVTRYYPSSTVANLAYKAELESDFDNGEIKILEHMRQNLKHTMKTTLLTI